MEVQMHLRDVEHNKLLGIDSKPKPKNRFYEAVTFEQAGKLKEAECIYVELMNDHFGNTALMAALGMNLAVQEKHGIAHALLSAAYNGIDKLEGDLSALGVTIDEKQAGSKQRFLRMKRSELMNAIGTTWKHENKIDKARYWFERAKTTFGEPSADIENNLATLYINEGKPSQAMTHLTEAIRIDPRTHKRDGTARWRT